jgi:hypothetical protein
MFEHVAAQRIVRVYEEARPFEQRREPAQRAANRGVLSLITFFTRVKKVIGVRGRTPRFCFNRSCFDKLSTNGHDSV